MTEQEQAHRLETEKSALEANIASGKESLKHARTGLIAGATVSILAILGAVASVWLGAHPAVSIALVSVPVLGMVKALIGNKQDK